MDEPVKLSKFVANLEKRKDVDLKGVKFTRTSAAGENGFPHALEITSYYLLSEDDQMLIVYEAKFKPEEKKEEEKKEEEKKEEEKTEEEKKKEEEEKEEEPPKAPKKTPINMTNHTYWNLSGDFKIKNIRTHRLKLECDKYLVQNEHQIPTGEIKSVEDSVYDFRSGGEKAPLLITANDRLDGAVKHAGENGIDDCFVINRPENNTGGDNILRDACRLIHHSTGRELKISTTQNCLIVYTGNFLPKDSQDLHKQYAAICLEPGQFNNAVNMLKPEWEEKGWPKEDQVLFKEGAKEYKHTTLYEFL